MVIGWLGMFISIFGIFLGIFGGAPEVILIGALISFQSSVMIVGFGILAGNSDKLVEYARRMANKDQ